jgi:hypothetical protein
VVDPEASSALAECLARIRQLEEENAHLRQAAKTFGDLAERLKHALDVELGRVTGLDGDGRDTYQDQDLDPDGAVAAGPVRPSRLTK